MIPTGNPPALIGYYLGIASIVPFVWWLSIPAVLLGALGIAKAKDADRARGTPSSRSSAGSRRSSSRRGQTRLVDGPDRSHLVRQLTRRAPVGPPPRRTIAFGGPSPSRYRRLDVPVAPGEETALDRLGVLPFLLPGWRGDLVPVPNDQVILAASQFSTPATCSPRAVPARGRARSGTPSTWAATPRACSTCSGCAGSRRHVVAPSFAAHIPPGSENLAQRADGYYRVDTHLRWPWWWPGGGVDWQVPGE